MGLLDYVAAIASTVASYLDHQAKMQKDPAYRNNYHAQKALQAILMFLAFSVFFFIGFWILRVFIAWFLKVSEAIEKSQQILQNQQNSKQKEEESRSEISEIKKQSEKLLKQIRQCKQNQKILIQEQKKMSGVIVQLKNSLKKFSRIKRKPNTKKQEQKTTKGSDGLIQKS